MATLKITSVDEDVVQFVASRTKELHFKGQAEYLRNLVREDMTRAATERRNDLVSILQPIHDHASSQGYSDDDLAAIFEKARDEVSALRKAKDSARK